MERILIVDDEEENLILLQDILEENGFETVPARDGVEAMRLLEDAPDDIGAVLLDRLMPNMDGMEVLRRMKALPQLRDIPVIIQSSMARNEEILEGLHAGALYYLTKPYPEEMILVAQVRSAVNDHVNLRTMRAEVQRSESVLHMTERWELTFNSIDEARELALILGKVLPGRSDIAPAILELFLNAVEHGNLGITYEDKSRLNNEGRWREEVDRRMLLQENLHKHVRVVYQHLGRRAEVDIRDDGPGFDWRPYLEFSPDRVFDNHGRGIAMSRLTPGVEVEFLGRGNRVRVTIAVDGEAEAT